MFPCTYVKERVHGIRAKKKSQHLVARNGPQEMVVGKGLARVGRRIQSISPRESKNHELRHISSSTTAAPPDAVFMENISLRYYNMGDLFEMRQGLGQIMSQV